MYGSRLVHQARRRSAVSSRPRNGSHAKRRTGAAAESVRHRCSASALGRPCCTTSFNTSWSLLIAVA
eukprot:10155193-Prorocentrum_lima.AAC.1